MHITCQKRLERKTKSVNQQDQGGCWKLKRTLQKAEMVSEKGKLKRT